MKTFKVLGSGCAKCKSTVQLIETAANELAQAVKIEKIEDPAQIMAYAVMSTPAVVMDEVVVHKGGIPNKEQILKWLHE